MRTHKGFRWESELVARSMVHPSAHMATTHIIRTLAHHMVITGHHGLTAESSLEQGRGIAAVGAAATMVVTEHVASTADAAITAARHTAADTVAAIGAGITPVDTVVVVPIAVAAASVEAAEQSVAEVDFTEVAGFTAAVDTADAGKFA